ncbi:MAG: glutamate--tRNA ligase [Rhodospirillaceae bacterium]
MHKNIRTRFAPSPTGYLHIGGARTALFNMLFARHFGGTFLLRIEDTDRKRSTIQAIQAIINGLEWLGLTPDEPTVFQSRNIQRHKEAAESLIQSGQAYFCYCTANELEEMRKTALARGESPRYDGRWRERDQSDAPKDVKPVIRFKSPQNGKTDIFDLVQGNVSVENRELDDMVLLRADGSPTYMLSVVVDDHDMKITHAIRGNDHLTNAFRQTQLFKALGWSPPHYAHIPLIHGPDGSKMSKRHGALGVEAYREMGYLPEAILNYLMRLGWSHGDDEIVSMKQAIEWFELHEVNKSASRFDFDKLNYLNAHYIKSMPDDCLISLIEKKTKVNLVTRDRLKKGLAGLKERAKTINEIVEKGEVYLCSRPIKIESEALSSLTQECLRKLQLIATDFQSLEEWSEDGVKSVIHNFIEHHKVKMRDIALPLRIALSGSTSSPGLFELSFALGKEEVLGRISDATGMSSRI